MAERRKVRVAVVEAIQYIADWPPDDLVSVIAWFERHLESIPSEWQDRAKCIITSQSDRFDDHYATISISYTRPETDEEVAARLRDERWKFELAELTERREYERLKAKYEGGQSE